MNLKLTFYNFKRQLTYFFLFISTLVFAQSSDLVVTKTINNTTPLVGSNVIFTITARNNWRLCPMGSWSFLLQRKCLQPDNYSL